MRTHRAALGGLLGERTAALLPSGFVWEHTQTRFTELAAIHGGRAPHSLPPDRRLTGYRLRQLAGVA